MIFRSRNMFNKTYVRHMCTPRRLPNLKSWPGIEANRQIVKPNTNITTVVKCTNNDTKNDKIYTDKWTEGFLPEEKSQK